MLQNELNTPSLKYNNHLERTVAVFPPIHKLKQCRHGAMLYNIHDIYIGRSLDLYGEFSEGEVDIFQQVVQPGYMVLEIGANIGAHTVVLAQTTGPTGRVIAFEPQRVVHQLLCANLALNHITNTHAGHAAIGNAMGQIIVPNLNYAVPNNFGGLGLGGYDRGESVPVFTVDSLGLNKCHFIKIDVEGMEQEVLEGAAATIGRLSPILYVENDRQEKSDALIRYIASLGYNMYWHTPPLYNPNNIAGNKENVFGGIVSKNMLCIPQSIPQRIEGLQMVVTPSGTSAS